MNTPTQTLPMTDLGRLLSGPMGQKNMIVLNQTLEHELHRVRQSMAKGLGKDDYVYATKRVVALTRAQMVLKSLHIYLAESFS